MSYTKINKSKARKLYGQHKNFIIVPSNMRPDSFMAMEVHSRNFYRLAGELFDSMVNNFEYYNCTCLETGTRAAFYIKVE